MIRVTVKTGVVSSFRGEHFFLSNFYTAAFTWRGESYASAEQAFQGAKVYHMVDADINDMRKYINLVKDSIKPEKARQAGRTIKIDTESWDAQKVTYMREIVHAKFMQCKGLAGQLINTGAMMLVEGNDWGDTFWGRCKNSEGKIVGLNTLGVILMEERGWWSRSDIGRPDKET